MLLTVLFILATLLLFFSAEPYKAAGVFLSLCYLPGLSCIALGKQDNLSFEDLLLAFPVSIGLSGFITLVSLFLGLPVKYVLVLVHFFVAVDVLFYIAKRYRKKIRQRIVIDKQSIYYCVFALLLTLIFSIPFFIGPNRGPIASHAFHHSSFVSQILNGIFPPENPGLGGTKIGYYWGFHALIAALTSRTGYHNLQIIFALNAVSLFMIMCLAYILGKSFNLSEKYRYLMPLATIGLMRSDAGILFMYKLVSGKFIFLKKLAAHHQYLLPNNVIDAWLDGLPWMDTRLLYLNKFYNISAMPLAICLCLAYFLLLIFFIKKGIADRFIYLFSFCAIISASIICYPPLAVVPLLFTPVWAFVVLLLTGGGLKEKVKETSKYLLPYGIALLLLLPYIIFIITSRDVSSSGQGGIFAFDFYDQSKKNIVVYLIPLPVILYGIWVSGRKLFHSRELVFLMASVLFCIIMTVFTRWPFDNSYKYNYILIFFFALFFVFGVSGFLSQISGRGLHRFILTVTAAFLLSSPLLVESAYIASCLSMERFLIFSGGHILYAQDKIKNEAYAWIRDNTPPDALIMLSYTKTPNPCCGINPNYEAAAIAERNEYVIKDTDYTTSNPEYAKRIFFREQLFKNPDDPRVTEFFTSLGRPVYLLIEKNLPERFTVEERFKKFASDPGGPFVLVFQNKRQKIYRLQLKGT